MPKSTAASSGKQAARSGTAGRAGDDVRSDLWVAVELRDAGGIELGLRSRVAAYYGEAIREQVRSVLGDLGVEHARIELEDQGALPFVIAARVEAAAAAAGVEANRAAVPERLFPLPPPSPRERLRRSRLYLPGNEPKYFINAGLHEPDGIILDLEDSVHPDQKDAARIVVRNALGAVDFGRAERMVRINQLPRGLDDLRTVAGERPDLILIPKVETADEVRQVSDEIDRIQSDLATDRPLWLMPILESALGIERAFEIAGASDRIAALTLGLEDYAADLGVPKTAEGDESAYARRRVANAAHAAGVQAIDSVFGQVDDIDGLQRWGERARGLGFVGMGCLHPRQIRPIHEAFNPTAAQVGKALRIVEAFAKAQASGLGVVSLGSKMIDPPVIRQAERLVRQADELGLLPRTSDEDETQ